MRQAIVLALTLVCLAGAAEQWLEYAPPRVSALPAGTMGGTEQVLLPAGLDFPNADTLKYDDNIAANAWASYQAGNGFGVKFISPASTVTLAGAMVNLWAATWPVPGSNRFKVKVYQADGPQGTPGTLLFESDTIQGTRGSWNYVPVNTPIIDQNFFIFYIQTDSYPMCPGMSIDGRRNSADNIQWDAQGSGFVPANEAGDWLIRAVLDWTPQAKNLAPVTFGNLPFDTVPGININLQVAVRNLGTDTAPRGTHVKCRIDGPMGYLREYLNDTTVAAIPYRNQSNVTFRPTWRTPDTSGTYVIKVWTELEGEEFPANDTIVRTLNIARWITYADWATPQYLTWAGPQRATLFHPGDFNLNYPVEIGRVKSQFYWHETYPWDDSIFQYAIYAENGDSLWTSDTLRAAHQAIIQEDVLPPVRIESGDFYVAIVPRSFNGYPATLADGESQGHSFNGSPGGGWLPWNSGELFFSASAKTVVPGAVGEGRAALEPARVGLRIVPNPSSRTQVCWEIPHAGPMSIALYDVAGNLKRQLFSSPNLTATRGSFRFDAATLPSGIYLVKLVAGGSSTSTKLVVDR